MTVTVKIENAYSDGHESSTEVVLAAPDGDVDEWFEDTVFEHTGDGHGAEGDLGSCYVATITAADDPALVGVKHEWID